MLSVCLPAVYFSRSVSSRSVYSREYIGSNVCAYSLAVCLQGKRCSSNFYKPLALNAQKAFTGVRRSELAPNVTILQPSFVCAAQSTGLYEIGVCHPLPFVHIRVCVCAEGGRAATAHYQQLEPDAYNVVRTARSSGRTACTQHVIQPRL